MLGSLENSYALAFMKVFKTYDKKIVEQCQYYMGQLPIELKIINRQSNFFAKLNKSFSNLCKCINKCNDEYMNLCDSYNLSLSACNF